MSFYKYADEIRKLNEDERGELYSELIKETGVELVNEGLRFSTEVDTLENVERFVDEYDCRHLYVVGCAGEMFGGVVIEVQEQDVTGEMLQKWIARSCKDVTASTLDGLGVVVFWYRVTLDGEFGSGGVAQIG